MSPSYTQLLRMMGRAAAPEEPPAFDPTSIADLALWRDAVDSPMTLDGSNRVSEWQDLSGNANHAVMATAANQPTYSATGMNSLPAIAFGANPVRMDLTSTIPNGQRSIFVVLSLDNDGSSGGIIGHTTGLDGILYYTSGGQKMETLGSGNGGYHGFLDHTFPRTSGVGLLLTLTNANATGSANTAAYVNSASQSNTGGTGVDGILISRIGYFDSSASYNKLNGKIAALVIYSRVLTDTERGDVETYLIDKWSVA